MTSEELILLLDDLQPRLPKCANQVLLRLVAKCIINGTNQVEISAAELNRGLHMGEDAVKVAKRALAGIVDTQGGNGLPTTWILPDEWFVVQRSLFAIDSPVQNWRSRPGNNGAAPWKPGHQASQLPGSPALETRAQWTRYQGAPSRLPGRYDPGNQGAPEPDSNNYTPPRPGGEDALDRSNRALSSVEGVFIPIESIERVNFLPAEFRPDGETVKRWLRDYFGSHHPSHNVPEGPDEIIRAKCLAIAPLPRLAGVLKVMDRKGTRPGDAWSWFVTVFCQRIHGTRNLAAVQAPPAFCQPKKNPSSEGPGGFHAELLQEVTAGARRL